MILRTAADREVGDGDEIQEKENGVLKGGNRAIARIIFSESPPWSRPPSRGRETMVIGKIIFAEGCYIQEKLYFCSVF